MRIFRFLAPLGLVAVWAPLAFLAVVVILAVGIVWYSRLPNRRQNAVYRLIDMTLRNLGGRGRS